MIRAISIFSCPAKNLFIASTFAGCSHGGRLDVDTVLCEPLKVESGNNISMSFAHTGQQYFDTPKIRFESLA